MAGITCYNIDGTPLSHLTQWDKNIVLVLRGAETSPEPEIHFSNKRSQTAIIVDPEISGDSISVEVPNVLLEDGYPLTVRIYYTYDDGSSRTRYTKFINVQPKARPDDYVGSDPDAGDSGDVDLSDYAKKEWVQDRYQPKGEYLTEVPDGYVTIEQVPTKPSDIGAQPVGDYALKEDIPSVPVQSVNGKTGAIQLNASDVKARPDSWIPTVSQVGADPSGTASSAVSSHNTSVDAHSDLRLELKDIAQRLNAFFDSDDQTMDELSEIVAYIKSNKTLIDSITTSKVSVADIVNNLTTNAAGKPLSAAQGVALKALIDAIIVPTKLSQLTNDSSFVTSGNVQTVVNSALTEAKNSGQFDGKDGVDGEKGYDGAEGLSIYYTLSAPERNPDYGLLFTLDQIQYPLNRTVKKGDIIYCQPNGNIYEVASAASSAEIIVNVVGNINGAPGSAGKDGTSVTVKSVSESTADGGSNVVTFSDGKTVTIKNGSKGGTGSTGATGPRGTGLLAVTTAPSSYTTAVGGITPKYRMAISTIKTQAGVEEVVLGDTVRYSYYHYPIDYLDASYAYFETRVSIRGAAGTTPVKGTDYYTDTDKTEMVGLVKAALPAITITGIDADGVSHTWTMYGVAN